ncbi:uncharacterized protein Pyn_16627 [Prunus yedoensis var. nudiflora]|uniref:Uncharacterized protein n=1 Tax=Prunus yedoensis var. nudiflora TaxID=2094558 RepID=A0A314V2X3_PRUYE|nr:uncharacterized protein Pyn_16627 [Prunus yedoensis var. nudiflora]
MAKNYEVIGFCGIVEAVPSSNNNRQQMNISNEVQNQVRSSYKDQYGGSSSNSTQSYKAREYVDKRSGHTVYKQEAKYTCNDKFVDKQQGVTTEYKTQLKVTKSVYPNKGSNSKSSNNRINYY